MSHLFDLAVLIVGWTAVIAGLIFAVLVAKTLVDECRLELRRRRRHGLIDALGRERIGRP